MSITLQGLCVVEEIMKLEIFQLEIFNSEKQVGKNRLELEIDVNWSDFDVDRKISLVLFDFKQIIIIKFSTKMFPT